MRQTLTVVALHLRSAPHRIGSSLVIVAGVGAVVAVLIPVLAMSLGFRETLRSDGRADRAVVLSRDAPTEGESSLSRETIATLLNSPDIKRDERNKPIASAEIVMAVPVARKSDSSDVNVTLRGVGEAYFRLRPELRLVTGRMSTPGTHEMLVGVAAQSEFSDLNIGDRIRLPEGDWTIVGTFAGPAGARDSELVADVQSVMSAYKLDAFNSFSAMLVAEDRQSAFQQYLAGDARLFVQARSEPEYLAASSAEVNRLMLVVANAVCSIMALGALFAAINSMHAATVARTTEIATLRALGFAPGAVALAVLAEACLLALLGAAIGAAISVAAFDGATISTRGGALWDSQLVYSLRASPTLIAGSMLLACGLGLAGGALPALRAARLNIVRALREV